MTSRDVGRTACLCTTELKRTTREIGSQPDRFQLRRGAPRRYSLGIVIRQFCRMKASILMEFPHASPRMPAEYYRREAARVRRVPESATTPAIKRHLRDVAGQSERLAQRTEWQLQPEDERAE